MREGGEGEESRALGEVSDSKFPNDDRQRESSATAGVEHVRLHVSRRCCTVVHHRFAVLQQVGKTLQDQPFVAMATATLSPKSLLRV